MNKVFACKLTKTRYFNVKADTIDQVTNWLITHDLNDVDNYTKDYHDEYGEQVIDSCDCVEAPIYKPHFSIATEYEPVYSEEADITFILKRNGNALKISGFYYGKPDKENVERFKESGVEIHEIQGGRLLC